MLRTRKALSRIVLKVLAPVVATLVAALVAGSLPRATIPTSAPAAERTSGGKFAARIPGAASEFQPSGFGQRSGIAMLAGPVPAADATVSDAAKLAASLDGGSRPRFRLPLRTEARRLLDAASSTLKQPVEIVAGALGAKRVAVDRENAGAKAGGTVLPVASSAGALWSATVPPGGAALSPVAP